MRPIAIPTQIRQLWKASNTNEENIVLIKQQYSSLSKGEPEVSIVIPAYNEEKSILRTLVALTSNRTSRSVEIIVVNNNSTDNTEQLVKATGVVCVREPNQGITAARNAGLAAAKGTYVLNADADSLYPADWIEKMVAPLAANNNICITYGKFAFLPSGKTLRLTYFFYEYMADTIRWVHKKFKEEAVNVHGFNSGFRRTQGLEVNGFEHPTGANEDGWLAVKLRDKGFGKLYCVTDVRAMVWTSDRRIEIDGGLWKALFLRIKRSLFPSKEIIIRKDL